MAKAQEQEARTERGTVMLTPDEKRAIRFVSDARGVTESDTLRDHSIAGVMAEYERIRAVLESAA